MIPSAYTYLQCSVRGCGGACYPICKMYVWLIAAERTLWRKSQLHDFDTTSFSKSHNGLLQNRYTAVWLYVGIGEPRQTCMLLLGVIWDEVKKKVHLGLCLEHGCVRSHHVELPYQFVNTTTGHAVFPALLLTNHYVQVQEQPGSDKGHFRAWSQVFSLDNTRLLQATFQPIWW